MLLRRRSLGELKDLGHVRVLRGRRIDPIHHDPGGSVSVLSAPGTRNNTMRLDPFDATRFVPKCGPKQIRGMWCSPNDPRPNRDGRRPRGIAGGLTVEDPPNQLASWDRARTRSRAIINRLLDEVTEWQTWNVPILDTARGLRGLEDRACPPQRTTRRSSLRHLDATRGSRHGHDRRGLPLAR